jgi:hypothetical protein
MEHPLLVFIIFAFTSRKHKWRAIIITDLRNGKFCFKLGELNLKMVEFLKLDESNLKMVEFLKIGRIQFKNGRISKNWANSI